MTSGFPGSPRVQKGALLGLDPVNPLASVIVFQYNPDEVTRTVTAGTLPQERAQSQTMRLTGPPEETVAFTIEIDAADQLERADPTATRSGVAPVLASLELLLYPKSALVMANSVLAASGIIEVVPMEAPLALLVWGPKRVLPVRLSAFTITEEAFDPGLNPIRARVALSLRVLTYDDLGLLHPGGALFLAHQIAKEAMATAAGAAAIGAPASATPPRGG